jgi:diguanylate cyclase (GGDEF)-like protein
MMKQGGENPVRSGAGTSSAYGIENSPNKKPSSNSETPHANVHAAGNHAMVKTPVNHKIEAEHLVDSIPPRTVSDPHGQPPGSAKNIHHILLMGHGTALRSKVRGSTGIPSPASPEAPRTRVADLACMLRDSGYQVTTSTSPLDSQRLLEKIRPSAIVLDPLIPTAEGIEFEMIADIQKQGDPIPLLLLVGNLRELQEIRRIPILFKDFLVHPFRAAELLQRIELLLVSKERFLELQTRTRTLEGQIIRDFKTGLYTERHFRHLLRQEFQRAERHHLPLSFLLIDVDNFKQINDNYEYSFGDFVLKNFAQILQNSIRDIDHAARFGGDEFMALLPNTTPAEAVQVAARIRQQLSKREFDNGTYQTRLTISIGADTYDGRGLSSPEDLRRRANLALKEAKARGKNRIWLYSGVELKKKTETERADPPLAPEQEGQQ